MKKPVEKRMSLTVPHELWLFLRKTSAIQERSMTEIIITLIDNYKTKLEKRLDM